jgi:hypothetical protein
VPDRLEALDECHREIETLGIEDVVGLLPGNDGAPPRAPRLPDLALPQPLLGAMSGVRLPLDGESAVPTKPPDVLQFRLERPI